MEFAAAVRESIPVTKNLSLAEMDYADELSVKNKAFALFCAKNGLPPPEPVVESPRPRGYRTTTKRRAAFERGIFRLTFGTSGAENDCAELLEPAEHLAVYRFVESFLQKPAFRSLAAALNWVIVRGSYLRRAVIFNVFAMDASVVRKLKLLGEHLNASGLGVVSAHVYFDPTRSAYYLESERPSGALDFKTLYGPRELSLDLGKFRLKYPVTGFSQINASQIPNLLRFAGELLSPNPKSVLLDLYCGYGLFSFGIGEAAKSTFGVEWEGPSIGCAKASAKFLHRKAQFVAGKIDANFVEKRIPHFGEELLLLDPPRQGVERGVIPALAERRSERVLHIFCGTDEIPRSANWWRASRYRISRIQPLDLFPGTPHLETMVLFEPA